LYGAVDLTVHSPISLPVRTIVYVGVVTKETHMTNQARCIFNQLYERIIEKTKPLDDADYVEVLDELAEVLWASSNAKKEEAAEEDE
jgi:uncharacterized membrane protein YfbV (UPF0208 family)